MLSQLQDGAERVITYASRTLSQAEQKYCVTRKEMLSVVFFTKYFTAAGVVPCGGRKTSLRTSTIVQFIFYFVPLRSAIIF